MSSEPILQVAGLAKSYRLYDDPRQRLWEALCLGRRKLHREFWALRDISFTVGRGESVGIIGRNGSGKSTLLQCIAGTLEPTAGRVETQGRVAALLELGSGFNPEFTGRENVLLACAVLGLSRREAQERFAAIADFADIGEFLDQPVKTYSSGMAVRLAFAVQTAVEPDLLIVDEALAVGDIFFQQKCARRMREMQERGVTLLFVSHDMGLIHELCSQAIYLRQGVLVDFGPSLNVAREYFKEVSASGQTRVIRPAGQGPAPAQDAEGFAVESFLDEAVWVAGESPAAGGKARMEAMSVLGPDCLPTASIEIGTKLRFRVLYRVFTEEPVHFTLNIKSRYDQLIYACTSANLDLAPPAIKPGGYGLFEMEVDCLIQSGQYTYRFTAGIESGVPNQGVLVDETPWLGPLSVHWDYENRRTPVLGLVGLPTVARFTELGS